MTRTHRFKSSITCLVLCDNEDDEADDEEDELVDGLMDELDETTYCECCWCLL